MTRKSTPSTPPRNRAGRSVALSLALASIIMAVAITTQMSSTGGFSTELRMGRSRAMDLHRLPPTRSGIYFRQMGKPLRGSRTRLYRIRATNEEENKPDDESLIPPGVQNAVENAAKIIAENPQETLIVAGAAGLAATTVASLSNFFSTMPGPLMALEEALGVAVCAYYIPKYTLSAQKRKELRANLAAIWTKATGKSSPFTRLQEDDVLEDSEFEMMAESEVMAAIDDVLTTYNSNLSPAVREALTKALQEIRLEDIRYRQDYKTLAEEFEEIANERKSLAERVDVLEGRLAASDEACVKATKRVSELEATLRSTELEGKVVLDRTNKALQEAQRAAADALQQKEKFETELFSSKTGHTTKRLEAQVKALKSRLEEALDEQESAQQKAIDAEKLFKEAKNNLSKRVESLRSQLEIARLMEASREDEAQIIASQIDRLVGEEAVAANEAAGTQPEIKQGSEVEPKAVQGDNPVEMLEKGTSKAMGIVADAMAAAQGAEKAWSSLTGTKKERKALSRMTKVELRGECNDRGIDTTGKVAELRVRLRAARKAENEAIKAATSKSRRTPRKKKAEDSSDS
mmetsp:Transcript_11751/g.18670  ORF Transcript_11751/g.18670 Transcript_11751/m.18670 type:complete len:577 (-) Transcript_11751:179-1909(-)